MISRRTFLSHSLTTTVGILSASALTRIGFAAGTATDGLNPFKGAAVFDRILAKALAGNWQSLPIGQAMGHIAMELKGTPYVGFTLELSKDHEICSVNLTGLDCVTFFEDTLDFARMLKSGGRTPDDLLAQVTLTRYRDGKIGDFTSRLHYTTDWFANNQKKGVVHILAPDLPGAQPFTQKVGIMSEQPGNYRQLKAHPELVAKIREYENQINAHNAESMKYIPLADLAAVQSLLQTGDIVGVCTSETGIDIAHTGLVYQDKSGTPHFMDASSSKKNMKVTLEAEPISQDFRWSHKLTGAMFARPLEPKSA